jgi:hypothetical protein
VSGLTVVAQDFRGIEFDGQIFFSTPAGGHASNISLGD